MSRAEGGTVALLVLSLCGLALAVLTLTLDQGAALATHLRLRGAAEASALAAALELASRMEAEESTPGPAGGAEGRARLLAALHGGELQGLKIRRLPGRDLEVEVTLAGWAPGILLGPISVPARARALVRLEGGGAVVLP